MGNNLGLTASMNPSATIEKQQNPDGRSGRAPEEREVPVATAGGTPVEMKEISELVVPINPVPTDLTPQTVSAMQEDFVPNTHLGGTPNPMGELLQKKSGGNFSISITDRPNNN